METSEGRSAAQTFIKGQLQGAKREQQARALANAATAQSDQITCHRIGKIRSGADVRDDLEPRADVSESITFYRARDVQVLAAGFAS